MGNNTSLTRKLAASRHDTYRKSSHSHSHNPNNLEEEFSDLILHEVKKQENGTPEPAPNRLARVNLEDMYNEVNDGTVATDNTDDVLRTFLPVHPEEEGEGMQVDSAGGSRTDTPEHDWKNVDFTAAAPLALARNNALMTLVVSRLPAPASGSADDLVPVEIKWVNTNREPIARIAIIGSFSQWRDVIKLRRSLAHPNEYSTTVKLPLGVHKLLYIVNSEYRVSEQLPTATDREGIFFNWFEVLDPHRLFNHLANQQTHQDATTPFDANIIQLAGQHDTLLIQEKLNLHLMRVSKENAADHEHVENLAAGAYTTYHAPLSLSFLDSPTQPHEGYSSEIPEMFVNYDYFKNKPDTHELAEPPLLPAHLNNVLLNKMLGNNSLLADHFLLGHDPLGAPTPAPTKRPMLRRADSSYYASEGKAYHLLVPNHVILNHLMTTSIRNDILTVACITRYLGKFVTQIMHSPADTLSGDAR